MILSKIIPSLFHIYFFILNPANGALTVEFELLRYKNVDGRLLNGECCSGSKVSSCVDSSGNSCNPFWKICLTHQSSHQSPSGESQVVVMPTQMRSFSRANSPHYTPSSSRVKHIHKPSNKPARISSKNRNEPLATTIAPTTASTTTTTERPSFLKSIYNRVLGGIKSVQSISEYVSFSNTKNPYTIAPSCSLAFWITNVTQVVNENNTLLLKTEVPSNVMNKIMNGRRTVNREPEQVLVFIEIWNKPYIGGIGEKLIARHVEQTNITIQVKRNQSMSDGEYEWKDGGISSSVSNPSGNNSLTGSSFKGTEFKYQWRILSIDDEESDTNATNACPEGFKGSDCKEPICSSGCNSSHGYCEKAGECKCKFGWTGETCTQCLSMPGCVHGSCIKPFECRCQEGWSGMFCDKPTCKLGCHPQNGYCEHPGECRCRFGFKGENCSDCATMPGCQRGSCDQPLDCNCHQGWRGLFCSIPSCSDGCDVDHGWCRRPDECRCKVGWMGANCTECVPYPGCDHGSCSEPWTCNCDPGYGGITCDEKLNYCDKMESNPCQNGGTCLSVEKAEGGFVCQCSTGHEGHYCEKIKN